MSDLISREDAIEAIQNAYCKPCKERGDDHNEVRCRACDYDNAIIQIDALPSADAVSREEYDQLEALYDAIRIYDASAEAPTGELILRADAIELLTEIVFDEPPYFDSETLCRLYAEEQINTLPSAKIAETEPIVIRSKTLLPTKDFKEWAKRIREVNPNAVVIPCDAEVASAEAVHGEWVHDGQNFKGGLDWCHCSECGYKTSTNGLSVYRYCPNCGAKMTKGGDSE